MNKLSTRKWILVFCLFISLPGFLTAFAKQDFFKRFPNRYFVETGCWQGYGISSALQANFTEIHSIELSEHYYHHCRGLFIYYPKVHLWLGDSGQILGDVISNMNEPITFWLDGHFCGFDSAKAEYNTPLLQELECIKRHPIKTHTILIDDVRLFGYEEFDHLPLSLVVEKILEINPDYIITFEDGSFPKDILVAEIR